MIIKARSIFGIIAVAILLPFLQESAVLIYNLRNLKE
jgi:hypothetical protein